MDFPIYSKPIYREQWHGPTRRLDPEQFRRNHGTLNIFKEDNGGAETIREVRRPCSRRDANTLSSATKEFPSSGIRRVEPVKRSEPVTGIHMVPEAPGKRQHIQVVNLTPAYVDPMQMEAPRPLVYRDPRHSNTENVRLTLAYQGTSQQMRGDLLDMPLGKATRNSHLWLIDYTNQEKFCQAVRDHVQQRAKGIANFYFQLVNDCIGGVTSKTPHPTYKKWSLEDEPEVKILTLERCLDQLVSLTHISVTLMELADLLWDMEDYKCIKDERQLEELLSSLPVPFSDFAAAFGANSNNIKLTVRKI